MTTSDLEHLISKRAAARYSSHFSQNTAPAHIKAHPEPLSLGGGMPHYGFFPVESIAVHLTDAPFSDKKLETLKADSKSKNPVIIPKVTDRPDDIIDLKNGLQYSYIQGLKPLLLFLKEFVQKVYPPAYNDWEVVLNNGAGNGLNKVCDLFLDPGDVVLVEEFTFTPFLQSVENCGGIPIPIKLDFQGKGLDYNHLKYELENWEILHPGLPLPKFLYTIPTGQNPTGLTQPLELRKKIYKLAEKFDFGILEDDPYGYLTLPPYKDVKSGKFDVDAPVTVDNFVKELAPSYLTIDTSKRVVRVETFSKVFAPGLRLGYIIANKSFIKAINNYSNISTRSPSGPSQFLVNNVIQHLGGIDGWLEWIIKVRREYIIRRNVMLDALYASDAYKKNLITVIDPDAGMFITVVINYDKSKYTPAEYKQLTSKNLFYKTIENGVAVVHGPNMAFDNLADEHCNFVRLTIASPPDHATITEATNRFTKSVEELFEEIEKT
ncbi:hypothetical protein PACTADRAFT_47998 [Pachysolen tannophilus NRRL Y-2460]|uniref:Aminotransferase class I/classII large domain-containing protein n=1 Tax=Pachysolen tannophilus NRRL Y-2460 TaxID=669874 RepID=A0A1E4U2S9_PACTA|nr:hypothetical protein PACTADRAFT_47998 [Pachysolen tannophilus NRRL Y-2460]